MSIFEHINCAHYIEPIPFTEDLLLECASKIAGDSSPKLRDEYHLRAVELRAKSFVHTLGEIRTL